MRRVSLALACVATMLLGVAAGPGRAVRAQDATPGAGESGGDQMPLGVTAEPLGYGALGALPATGDLALFRLIFEPGAVEPIDPNDPSVGLVYVEAGTLTVRVEAPITVLRGAGEGHALPNPDRADTGRYRIHRQSRRFVHRTAERQRRNPQRRKRAGGATARDRQSLGGGRGGGDADRVADRNTCRFATRRATSPSRPAPAGAFDRALHLGSCTDARREMARYPMLGGWTCLPWKTWLSPQEDWKW